MVIMPWVIQPPWSLNPCGAVLKICQSTSMLGHLVLLFICELCCLWISLALWFSFGIYLPLDLQMQQHRSSNPVGAGSISATALPRVSQACIDIRCMGAMLDSLERNLALIVRMDMILQHSWVLEWHVLYLTCINGVSIIIGISNRRSAWPWMFFHIVMDSDFSQSFAHCGLTDMKMDH